MFNGEKLRDIRTMNGISRKDLAEKTGITEQAVWQYENGVINPRIDIIVKFSRHFEVDPKFFVSKTSFPYLVREDSIAYRNVDREQRAKTSSEAMYLEFVNDLVLQMKNKFEGLDDLILKLTESVENMRALGRTVEECAEYARKQLSIDTNKRLLSLIEQSGVIVLEKNFSTSKTDAYSSWVQNIPYIVLSTSKKSFVRRNFDLAHELGHLLMHRKVKITSLSKEEFRVIENEANEFASCLLLPKETFLRDLELLNSAISNPKQYLVLKKKYYVSIVAMGYRAFNLGKMTVNQKNYFFSNMNKFRYKTNEPFDSDWGIKKPNFLLSYLDFLDENGIWKFKKILEDNCYTLQFVSKLLSIDEEVLRKYTESEQQGDVFFPIFR
ncbi:helix-turn-helix domain-containing protein [Enterococcus italicus]|uniref:spr1629 family repressor/antitoxin n=1 Tax=Enterococcus italicus TaxID=246144 RepID=UPI00207306EF|nr:XRE family transcriptional regulator [Enterococcus italicus]